MTITRRLAALAVGATLAAGITAGCTASRTPDSYVDAIRAVMPPADAAAVADDEILSTGRMLCATPGALDTVTTAETDTSPEYVDYIRITAEHCDVLGTDPAAPIPAAAGPSPESYTPPPPATITVGSQQVVNYGGRDIATWTVDEIDRCGPYLRMTVTLTTSDLFQPGGTDGIAHRVQWTDVDGITHDGGTISAYDCGEQLVSPYSAQPGRTYQGAMTFDIPEGQLASLDIVGSDDRVNTYTPAS